MKIAIDIKSALGEKTGKGVFCYNIVKEIIALTAHGSNQIVLYTPESADPFLKELSQSKNVEVVQISAGGLKWHFKVFSNILRRHKKNELDIYFSPSSFIVTALLRWVKIFTLGFVKTPKFYITVHDLVAFLYPATHDKKAVLIEKLTLAPSLKGAEKIFAVSENTKKDIIAKFRTAGEKIVITYNSAPKDFKKPSEDALDDFRKKHNLPSRYILTLGTLVPRKNLKLTLQAFEKLCHHTRRPAIDAKKSEAAIFPTDINLVIVGGKGWGHGSRRRLARRNKAHSNHYANGDSFICESGGEANHPVVEHHVQERIRFLGYLPYEELPYIYAGAEIFVYPSLYEGFGIPPLEAQAVGCPVIVSNASSLPEVVGDSAIKIDPYDPDELAEAIKSLLTDSVLKQKLIKSGHENVKRFSWKESAEKILAELPL